MADNNADVSLVDPLSEVTRKERRMLLGLSVLGMFFVKAGILPSKISALGVELQSTDQNAFLYLMSLVLVYFTAAFFIYAMSDFIVWRKKIMKAYIDAYEQEMTERDNYPQHPEEAELAHEKSMAYDKNRIWFTLTKPMSIGRAVFEFVLPLSVGAYSIISILIYAAKNA